MQAIVHDRYGAPEVLRMETLPRPEPGPDQLLIEVQATSVTTADWRFRSGSFPRGMQLVGRLVAGLFRPRNRIPGRDFAGRVVAVGRDVTGFRPGDDVFGACPTGASAQFITMPQQGSVAKVPRQLSYAEAAALPFGALAAVHFLRDVAKIQPGERVLVMGASGGVGVYAVQVAKYLEAEVTAVCSGANAPLVRSLGADHVIDYTREDPARSENTWDVIIDPVGKTTFQAYRERLSPTGRHVFIEARLTEIWQSIVTPMRRGPKVLFDVSSDTQAALKGLATIVDAGGVRPVIGHRFAMEQIVEAHQVVDQRHRQGAVVVDIATPNEAGEAQRRST